MKTKRYLTYLIVILALLLGACTSTATSSTDTSEQITTAVTEEAVSNIDMAALPNSNLGNSPPGAGTGASSVDDGLPPQPARTP